MATIVKELFPKFLHIKRRENLFQLLNNSPIKTISVIPSNKSTYFYNITRIEKNLENVN